MEKSEDFEVYIGTKKAPIGGVRKTDVEGIITRATDIIKENRRLTQAEEDESPHK